jgi:PIN domain
VTTLILDTNALFAAVYRTPGFAIPLNGPFEELMLLTRLGEVRVVISEICIRETERRLRRECDPTFTGRARAAGARAKLGLSADSTSAEVAGCLADWRERFESVLKEHGVELVPAPEVDQAELLERLFREQRPFTGKGDDGYRDSLIWETALEEARDANSGILVSNDRRAFASSRPPFALHSTLQEEAHRRLGRANALALALTIDSALDLMEVERADRSVGIPDQVIADLIVEISHTAVDVDGEPGSEARALFGEEIHGWRLQRLVELRGVSLLPGRLRRIRAALVFDALLNAQVADEPGDELIGVDIQDLGASLTSWEWFVEFKHPIEVRADAFVGSHGEILQPRLVSWRLLGDRPRDPRQLQLS